MHGIGLSVDLYTEIICLCVRMLPLENINSSKHKRVLLSRVLNLLLLCHLHVPCDALTYLRTYANYKLYHGYDTKVMTMCVSKIVCKETQTQEIVAILKIALEIIGASEEIDTFLLRKKSSQGGKINRVSLAKSLGNYDKILKSIETPFNSVKSAKE